MRLSVSLMSDDNDDLQCAHENVFDLTSLLEQLDDSNVNNDSPYMNQDNVCSYYEPYEFKKLPKCKGFTSFFHLNCRGLSANWTDFNELINSMHDDEFSFDFLGLSESYSCKNDDRIYLPGYQTPIFQNRQNDFRGGVSLFIKNGINFQIRSDLSVFIPNIFESLFIEYSDKKKKKHIIGIVYRPNSPPKADLDIFSTTMNDVLDKINNENKNAVIMGDMNIDLLKYGCHDKTNVYLDSIFSHGFLPLITKPTRIAQQSSTLIDHIYSNHNFTSSQSGIIINDVADHYGTFHLLPG